MAREVGAGIQGQQELQSGFCPRSRLGNPGKALEYEDSSCRRIKEIQLQETKLTAIVGSRQYIVPHFFSVIWRRPEEIVMAKDETENEYEHRREEKNVPAGAMVAGRKTAGAAGGDRLGTQRELGKAQAIGGFGYGHGCDGQRGQQRRRRQQQQLVRPQPPTAHYPPPTFPTWGSGVWTQRRLPARGGRSAGRRFDGCRSSVREVGEVWTLTRRLQYATTH